MSQYKLFLKCNFFGEYVVYISNSTLMTTWGSRWLGETWVTCFLLPSSFLFRITNSVLCIRLILHQFVDNWGRGTVPDGFTRIAKGDQIL